MRLGIILSCISVMLVFLGCSSEAKNDKSETTSSVSKQVIIQDIEAFKPFEWRDSIYDVIKKIQEMPSNEGATLNTTYESFPLKKLSKNEINKIIDKALPESGYESMETYGNFEFLDKDGKKLIGNECSLFIKVPNLYLNDIKYELQINMRANAGADVVYPTNTIHIRKFHIPLVINEIRLTGQDMDEIARKDNGKITKTLIDKYSSIEPMIVKMPNGIVSQTRLIGKNGVSLTIDHTTFDRPQKMNAAFISYYAPESEYNKAYSDREISFKKKAGVSTDMSKSL